MNILTCVLYNHVETPVLDIRHSLPKTLESFNNLNYYLQASIEKIDV